MSIIDISDNPLSISSEDSDGLDEVRDEESVDEPSYITEDGRELYEHFRFEADKGQQLLRVDKFLVDRMTKT